MKIRILHNSYGCDTGCCGHVFIVDGVRSDFDFTHSRTIEEIKAELDQDSDPHLHDLDWSNVEIIDESRCSG